MEYENKLIKLLKLKVIKNNNILELYKDEEKVGKIEEIEEDNEKFYLTTINYKYFNFKRKRNIKEKDFIYKFQIQDWDNRIFIEMDLGDSPYLSLYSALTGVMSFSINDKELKLDFKTDVTSGSVLEHVTIRLENKSELYKYLGSYYSYKVEVTNNALKTKDIELIAYADNSYNKVLIVTDHAGREIRSKVDGTIRDTIRLDEHGKDAMSRFRAYINKLFPFDIDFLETFLEERGIRNDAFIELYPDLKKYGDYYTIREINNNTLLGIRLSESESPLRSYGDIICDLKDCYSFGYLKGTGDYSGSYTWNNDYVFRVSKNDEVESIFDIKNRKEIIDIEEVKRIYKEYKGSKVLTK